MWMNGKKIDYKPKSAHLAERERFRDELGKELSFGVEILVRKKMQQAALKGYVPKHTPERYLEFMNSHVTNFSVCSITSDAPYIYKLVASNVKTFGDTAEECMDQIIK